MPIPLAASPATSSSCTAGRRGREPAQHSHPEVAEGEFAEVARRWISPFRGAFPDFTMEIVNLVEEGDTVVAHFRCSGTHLGGWLGIPATGRRFENVDEVYVFQVKNGKLANAVGVDE